MFLALSGVPLVIVTIIAFVLIIGIIVAIHEGGHFFFAKKSGILCHEFSIGMGPVIFKKQFGETLFSLRLFPIGGFVSMAGEDEISEVVTVGAKIGVNLEDDVITEIILDDDRECMLRGEVIDLDLLGKNGEVLFITLQDDLQTHYHTVKRDAKYVFEKDKKLQIAPYDRGFDGKPIWQRFITIFAGPLMNFVLAIFIYFIVAFATGVPNYNSTKIGNITSSQYPSYEVLEAGDVITKVYDKEVNSWKDFERELDSLYKDNKTTIEITITRDGVPYTHTFETITIINSIGISNVGASSKELIEFDYNDTKLKGLELGTLAVRYKDESKENFITGIFGGNDDDTTGQLKKGDIITKVNVDYPNDNQVDIKNLEIESWSQLIAIFKDTNIANVTFEYYRLNEITDKYELYTSDKCDVIEPYTNEVLNNQRIEKISQKIGVSPVYHIDFFGCIGSAFEMFWNDFTLIFRTLKLLIAPSDVRQIGVDNLSSFVGIFSMVEQYIGAGFVPLLGFAALLSVNIGVMNLLPIPALDGGRLVFLLVELITKKKPSKKIEAWINNIFFILLMILFVYITFNDIFRLFG